MKTQLLKNTFLLCSLLIFSTACGQDNAMQSCDTDQDCPSSHFCASGGGVFFSNDQCVERLSDQVFDKDTETKDRDTTTDNDVNFNDVEKNDDAHQQPQNDCDKVCPGEIPVCDEFRDKCVVFVSKTGDDNDSGLLPDKPANTLAHAIELAVNNSRPYLIVTAGIFAEQVTLKNGISIYGGFDPDHTWTRNLQNHETIITGSTPEADDMNLKVVIADAINQRTILDGLTIYGLSTETPSASTFAVWVNQSSNLIVQNTYIVAGMAGHGNPGTDGTVMDCTPRTGGNGGASDPTLSPCDSKINQSGSPGQGSVVAGEFGEGGSGSKGICLENPIASTAQSGSTGFPGRPGNAGNNGLVAASTGSFNSKGQWILFNASQPQNGQNGSGGGGGGAGGHYELKGGSTTLFLNGGEGGSGANGGCGGTAGQNGMTGGSSFGLAAIGSEVTVRQTNFFLTRGGNGGIAGNGGVGEKGVDGAKGGAISCKTIDSKKMCSGAGGGGGKGGDGGDGGHGSGGHGGYAIGVVTAHNGLVELDESSVIFNKDDAQGGLSGIAASPELAGMPGGIFETIEF